MLVQAVVLHSRPYRENSQLVDLLSDQAGLIRALFRGKPASPGLTPFVLYECKLAAGYSDLYFVHRAEPLKVFPQLVGRELYLALYLNELTIKLIKNLADGQFLQGIYLKVLTRLAQSSERYQQEALLRHYELILIEELGVKPDFNQTQNGETILDNQFYCLDFDNGWLKSQPTEANSVPGRIVKLIDAADFSDPDTLKYAKRLMRSWLDHLLGQQPLFTRELFKRIKT
ncbi:DNA repair protein RecO [Gayadomonas joobiniege]|uniref:DNA repair protein RecO n=1 Tax=Gayadomonas joobiniege TaxID=1234606 RepID=UPI00036E6D0C|nr:DNA repair protein RecO [Gayadomonas joobiniege]